MSGTDESDSTYEKTAIEEAQQHPLSLLTNHNHDVYLSADSIKKNSDREMNESRKKRLAVCDLP